MSDRPAAWLRDDAARMAEATAPSGMGGGTLLLIAAVVGVVMLARAAQRKSEEEDRLSAAELEAEIAESRAAHASLHPLSGGIQWVT